MTSSIRTLRPGRPPQDRRRRMPRLTEPRAILIAAAIPVAATLITGAFTSWFGTTGGGGSSASSTGPTGSSAPGHAPHGLHREYADNRNGSPVFATAAGATAPGELSKIPFNTPVDVKCFATNTSGMQSVTGFYLVGDTKWKGLYVVADTMSNGGPPGNTNSPNRDPRVPGCP